MFTPRNGDHSYNMAVDKRSRAQTNVKVQKLPNRGVAVARIGYSSGVCERFNFSDNVKEERACDSSFSGSNTSSENTSESDREFQLNDGIVSVHARSMPRGRRYSTERFLPDLVSMPDQMRYVPQKGALSNNRGSNMRVDKPNSITLILNSIDAESKVGGSRVSTPQNTLSVEPDIYAKTYLNVVGSVERSSRASTNFQCINGDVSRSYVNKMHALGAGTAYVNEQPGIEKNKSASTNFHYISGDVPCTNVKRVQMVGSGKTFSSSPRQSQPRSDTINGKSTSVLHKGQKLYRTELTQQNMPSSKMKDDSKGNNVNVLINEQRRKRVDVLCPASENKQQLCRFVENDVVGGNNMVLTCFGITKITYLDYIASGRPLKCFEQYIHQNVLPTYSNTHTEVNHYSQQTSHFRNEARAIIRECVNASHDDAVIFTGSGATAAVHKLIHAMNLRLVLQTLGVTVFLGPYEHHSNILPWRELKANIITIPQTKNGLINLECLQAELVKLRCEPGRFLIGSFSAASNVTGILTDVNSVASLMHKYGGYAVFDYACAAPYTDIDMNPQDPQAYKDAVFISPHKFIGGPQTPGVLVAKKWMFRNLVPHGVGGGTVAFLALYLDCSEEETVLITNLTPWSLATLDQWQKVQRADHRYLSDVEESEEGGTPSIVESVRAGLTFKLKAAFTSRFIVEREKDIKKLAIAAWSRLPALIILGDHNVDRLPIFSMLFLNSVTGRLIHHNFIALILNDVFGMQVRSGCACAGPYSLDLLGISDATGKKYDELIWTKPGKSQSLDHDCLPCQSHAKNRIFKPGFVRLSLPYFISKNCFIFVTKALQMTSEKGWLLLPLYNYDQDTGTWWRKDKTAILKRAERIFAEANTPTHFDASDTTNDYSDVHERLRWFMLPSEAVDIVNGRKVKHVTPENLPFLPVELRNRLPDRTWNPNRK